MKRTKNVNGKVLDATISAAVIKNCWPAVEMLQKWQSNKTTRRWQLCLSCTHVCVFEWKQPKNEVCVIESRQPQNEWDSSLSKRKHWTSFSKQSVFNNVHDAKTKAANAKQNCADFLLTGWKHKFLGEMIDHWFCSCLFHYLHIMQGVWQARCDNENVGS